MTRAVPFLVIAVIFSFLTYAGYIGTSIDRKAETAENSGDVQRYSIVCNEQQKRYAAISPFSGFGLEWIVKKSCE